MGLTPMAFRVVVIAIIGCSASLTSCSNSGTNVVVPRSAANAYPAEASAALCRVGLHPRYLRAPALVQADVNINGYAVTSLSPGAGEKVRSGSVVDVTLNPSVNGGPPLLGPRPRSAVPGVMGLDVNKALREITTLGLHANVIATTPTGTLTVTGVIPAPGTTVPGGSTVIVHVGTVGSDACS